jgi:TRAP-type C4-dicarboxylate transport system permease small subunit
VHRIGKLLSRLIGFVTVLSGLAIALMMIHITADVISRYVFNYPLPGTISIVSNFYMVLAAFLPLAFAEQKSAHISVEVLTERFPGTVQRHLAGWLLLVSAVVFAVVTARGWGEALAKLAINASVVQGDDTIPIWPSYFFIPVGCGLMTLVCAYKFVVYLTGARSGLDAQRAGPGSPAAD